MKRKLQIGVMGSAADLGYAKDVEVLAFATGIEIAKRGYLTVFGAEKDVDSLSTAASRGARSAGGLTVGITYGKGLQVFEEPDITIATGLERGGGREFTLVLSCDAIITIGGGSGTLTEMVIAYQANIPIIGLKGTAGWTDQLVGRFIDGRERLKVLSATTPAEAVDLAETAISERLMAVA